MFDLTKAIAAWRQEIADVTPETLDELEGHLREEIEAQLRTGSGQEQAFHAATQQLGEAGVLKHEFEKISNAAWLKRVTLTLAGIPEPCPTTPMNTSYIEPRWATYVKGAGFLVPAVLLWIMTAIWVVPKLQQICVSAGLAESGDTTFWNLTYSSIRTTLFFTEHGLAIGGALIVLLGLLEWRSVRWPRYRRLTVGVGAFALNTVVLLSLFVMIVAALVVAPSAGN